MKFETMVASLRKDNDYLMKRRIKKELSNIFGEENTVHIIDAIAAKDDEEFKAQKELIVCADHADEVTEIICIIEKERERKNVRMPMQSVMELYHSGDDFLVKKSKEYVCTDYEKFVHNIIHKNFSTYASKYGEELFQNGTIGLLKAMENYDPNHGAFTTYSRFYIIHEISAQINYQNFDSTTYYTAMQKKVREAMQTLEGRGIEPTIYRISVEADMKPDIVKREMDFMESTKIKHLDDENEKEHPCPYEMTPDYIVQRNEETRSLIESINRLPDNYKKVVSLKFDHVYTNEQISNMTGYTIGQVKSYYQKGLQMMRQDKHLWSAYTEYLSDAEKEMLKYRVPKVESMEETENKMDLLDSFLDNTLFENITGSSFNDDLNLCLLSAEEKKEIKKRDHKAYMAQKRKLKKMQESEDGFCSDGLADFINQINEGII